MTKNEAIEVIKLALAQVEWDYPMDYAVAFDMAIKALEQEPTIKALGEELRKARKGIADEKVLIGYNLAVAICNKHLGESEDKE